MLCRARRSLILPHVYTHPMMRPLQKCNHRRNYSSSTNETADLDFDELLSHPTWSVRSLLPPQVGQDRGSEISPKQLHHLLKLSALPPPKTPEEEAGMLQTLSAQLQFVKAIQAVDTTGVKPLQALRDETAAAEEENKLTLDSLTDALAKEEVVGIHHPRIRRELDTKTLQKDYDHDLLRHASKKVGKYYVVETSSS